MGTLFIYQSPYGISVWVAMKARLSRALQWWKRVARRIGEFQARLLLTLFYIFILGPFALLIRWRGDPLAIKPRSARGWRPRTERKGTPVERAAEQF